MSQINSVSIDPITISSHRIVLDPVSLSGLDGFHVHSMYKELYEHLEFPPFPE